jgi:hypothetical protein
MGEPAQFVRTPRAGNSRRLFIKTQMKGALNAMILPSRQTG